MATPIVSSPRPASSGASNTSGWGAPGFWAAFSYGVVSILITLFNKAVMSTYHFRYTLTLSFLQGLFTVICLQFMKWRGWISYPNFSLDVALQVLPLSFVFLAYLVISLAALDKVNLPMFTALRRLTVLFVMTEEYFYFGTVPSRGILYSVGTQTAGAAIAAFKDLTFSPVSYFYIFLTNLFTSLYTVYINVIRNKTKLNVFGILYYNTVTTLPVLFVLGLAFGDFEEAWQYPNYDNVMFQISFWCSVMMAFMLNVSMFYCTTLNSARTQTVVGQIKNFGAFLLSLVLFDDYRYDPINFVGLLIGFAGGVQYSYVSYLEKHKKDAAKQLPQVAMATISSPQKREGQEADPEKRQPTV